MAVESKLYEVLPENYGYVLFVAADSIFVNMWMAYNCGRARKKYGIRYPIMYSNENCGDNVYNCVQRAHQNAIESYPSFLMLLLVSGLQYPKCSAAAGGVYLLGRFLYAKGYYTGEPVKRRPGFIMAQLGQLVLLGGLVSFATHQLGWL